MKITKTAAELTAKQMADEAMDTKINETKIQLTEFIRTKVEDRTPKELLPLFSDQRFNKYFYRVSSFRVSNNGRCDYYDYYYLDKSYPSPESTQTLDLPDEDYATFVMLHEKLHDLTNSKKKLTARIYDAIISFGTIKRLESDFPEAFEAMPAQFKTERVTTSVAVPVEELLIELNFYRN